MSIPMPSPSPGTSSSSSRSALSSSIEQQHSKDYYSTRERNDSSSTTDSGVSMGSLKDSLPDIPAASTRLSNQEINENDNDDDEVDAAAVNSNDDGIDKYEKALRRYSCDVAAHTAHMFESCYGGEIDSSSSTTTTSNTEARRSGTPSNSTKRNSATKPPHHDETNGSSSPSKRN